MLWSKLTYKIVIYLDIDEISPDEDEASAQAALQKVPTKKRKAHAMEDGEQWVYITASNHISYHTIIFVPDDEEGTFDVVAAYQERNRKPKAPSADHLRQSAAYQGRWPRRVPDSDEEVIPDSEPEEEPANDLDNATQSDGSDSAEEPAKKRVKRNSQHHGAKPTQLQFYPGHWRDVLERAKEFFRLWMIKECPFPQRDTHLCNARHALTAAMEEFEAKGFEVEDGKSMSTYHTNCL